MPHFFILLLIYDKLLRNQYEIMVHNFAMAVALYVSFFKQVTYVLEGVTAHEDFCGHSGQLKPGDLQVQHNSLFPILHVVLCLKSQASCFHVFPS